jgi:hypothetical protein
MLSTAVRDQKCYRSLSYSDVGRGVEKIRLQTGIANNADLKVYIYRPDTDQISLKVIPLERPRTER